MAKVKSGTAPRGRQAEAQLSDIRAFVTIVEQGSFSRAAVALGISQPTVSVRLQNLEDTLGLRLIDRRQGGALTDMGRPAYGPARQLLTQLDAFEAAARAFQALQRGHLKVGYSTPPFAMSLLGAFRRAHPGVELALSQGHSWGLIEQVRRSEIDVAILTLKEPPQEPLAHVLIARQCLAAMVPSDHALAGIGPVPWARLMQEPILLRKKPSMTYTQVEIELAALGLPLDPFLALPSRESVKEAVASGFGLGLAFASEIGADARIAEVPIADAADASAVFVVTQSDLRGLPAVAGFMDIARSAAADG